MPFFSKEAIFQGFPGKFDNHLHRTITKPSLAKPKVCECNLPQDDLNALQDLINLQKERKVVLKACNKRAGIIIINLNDYVKACNTHLLSETIDGQTYYSEVNELDIEKVKGGKQSILKEGLAKRKKQIRNKFDAMCMESKGPGRFYCNFKVH